MKSTKIKNKKPSVENYNMNNEQKTKTFSYSIYNKTNFKKFCELKYDKSVKMISKNNLPSEFNEELCNFINLFRAKTVNEKTEWEFYIDYENNEIIHCLHGKSTNVGGLIHSSLMENKKILTIPNHIKGTYSAPSWKNFEILDHEFEDYEIICSEKEFWILEAKGKFNTKWINDVKKEIHEIYKRCDNFEGTSNEKMQITNSNKLYENELKIFINNLKSNIKLTKKEYEQHD